MPSLVLLCLDNISLPSLVVLVYLLPQPVVIQPLVQCHWYLLLQYPGDPRLQAMLDKMVLTNSTSGAPTFQVNFPHMLQDPVGNMRRFNNPRYRLAHDIPDMQWDDINLNLASQVDFMIPHSPSPRPPQQIDQPSTLAITVQYLHWPKV